MLLLALILALNMLLPMEALAAVGPESTDSISFSVPETLSIKATQGKSELTIDPCVIKNTSAFVGNVIMLSSVEITAADGWSIVASSTDFTAADSKNKIAFTAGSHDFADGAYTPKEEIHGMSNATLQLAGKISEKADLTNATQVASMVVTVEKAGSISTDSFSAYIKDDQGNTLCDVPMDSIIVTKYGSEPIEKEMEDAYTVLRDSYLPDVIIGLDSELESMGIDAKSLGVYDFRNVKVINQYSEYLTLTESTYLEYRFKPETPLTNDCFIGIEYVNGEWVIMDKERMVLNSDGTVISNLFGPSSIIAILSCQ